MPSDLGHTKRGQGTNEQSPEGASTIAKATKLLGRSNGLSSPICIHNARHSVEFAAMKQPAPPGPAAECPAHTGISVSAPARGASNTSEMAAAPIAHVILGIMTASPDVPALIRYSTSENVMLKKGGHLRREPFLYSREAFQGNPRPSGGKISLAPMSTPS